MNYIFNDKKRYGFKGILGSLFIMLFLFTGNQLKATNSETIDAHINNITVGNAIEYKSLKLFPLIAKKELSTKNYVTLDEASEKKWLTIKELKDATHTHIEIKNTGKLPVFIMKGEVVKGAKQDRILRNDIYLKPSKTFIKIPAYCVEQGRWKATSSEFASAKTIVPSSLRKNVSINSNQSEVWNSISSTQQDLGVSSDTEAVMDIYKDKKTTSQIDEYTKHLKDLPQISKNIVGVVVTTNNEIVCCDIFANNNLFNKLWKKLLQSYAFAGISGKKSTVKKQKITDFIAQLKETKKTKETTPGSGALYSLESDKVTGSALVYGLSALHMDFFPGKKKKNKQSGSFSFPQDSQFC